MKCGTIFYIGLGDEETCGRPAVALVDGIEPACAECAKYCHPSRLTPLGAGAAGSVQDAGQALPAASLKPGCLDGKETNMELGKLYCETDAAWEAFCRFPSDSTWALYVDAKAAEDAASR